MRSTYDVVPYHPVSVLLHWVLGLGLIGVFAMGLYMADLPFSPQRLKLFNWHKWAGITVLALSLVRLLWRWTHRPPPLPPAIAAAMPRWQHGLHQATHLALYLLFFVVPLLGWAYSSATGFQVVLFGIWPLPDFVPVSEELAGRLKALHKGAAMTLMALVALHVAGALKHQFIDRDGLIARMRLGRR
jgi:cytochrome b561